MLSIEWKWNNLAGMDVDQNWYDLILGYASDKQVQYQPLSIRRPNSIRNPEIIGEIHMIAIAAIGMKLILDFFVI
jgi:hypothetical protein